MRLLHILNSLASSGGGPTHALPTLAQAQAAGFMIVEQNVREVGRSVSGASASSDGLGSMFFNPASITKYEGMQGAAAMHVIIPSAEFSGSRTPEAPLPAVPPFTESGSGKTDEMGLVPNAYLVADINEKIKFGLGLNAPFGLVTEYDPTWVGRYHAIRSDLKTNNINPTIGYKANDKLSLGSSVSAMSSSPRTKWFFFVASISNAIVLAPRNRLPSWT